MIIAGLNIFIENKSSCPEIIEISAIERLYCNGFISDVVRTDPSATKVKKNFSLRIFLTSMVTYINVFEINDVMNG